LLGVSAIVYFFFFVKGPKLPDAIPQHTALTTSRNEQNIEVEDVDATDSEDEGGEAEGVEEGAGKAKDKLEAFELKETYDTAVRLAGKLIKGEKHIDAVEKLNEAIILAPQVPEASKDVLLLYNNRSAMYEKLRQYEDSLRDIMVVLTMDPGHMKARLRRARIYEAQVPFTP
jgi:hypothetical protein